MKLIAIAMLAVMVLLALGGVGPGRGRLRSIGRRLHRARSEQRIEHDLTRLAA